MYCGCFQSKCCENVALSGTSVMAGNVLSVCTVKSSGEQAVSVDSQVPSLGV